VALFDRETDASKELAGVPLDFGEFRVTLRRQGGANEAYEKELEKAIKPFRAALRAGVFPKAKEEALVFGVFARACVVKWETLASTLSPASLKGGPEPRADGFVDGIDFRGKLVPCTEENLVRLFTALPGVYLDVRAAATGEQLFRLEQREADAGN
jgi:hypothetical protein